MLFWIVGLAITISIAGFVFWLFWWPLRLFLFSLIPAHAAYAWVGKLLVIIIVGWLGGIGIPLILLAFGVFILVNISDES